MRDTEFPKPVWFLWLLGQDDNIGDVVLRRRLLRAAHDAGTVHVYVGRASSGYVESLTHDLDCTVYTDSKEWLVAALKAASRPGFGFAFNPGEVRANKTIGSWYLKVAPLVLLAKLRRQKILSIGLGLFPSSATWLKVIAGVTRRASTVAWRDTESPAAIGFGRVAPDLAFAENPIDIPTAERNTLAVTFRSDRTPPSDETIDAMREFASENQLDITAFVQVRHDSAATTRLAEQLGANLLEWPEDRDHWQQEVLCRELFSRSRVVVSDRLHGLIMGASEGAIPLPISNDQDSKLARHFAAIELHDMHFDTRNADKTAVQAHLTDLLDREAEIHGRLDAARRKVQSFDPLFALR